MSTASAAAGSGRADRRRNWLARRTLRGRLIAGLLALLAVACAAVGAVTYVSLHSYLLGQLDQQLVQASGRYQACLGHPPPGHDGDNEPGPPHSSAYDCAQQQEQRTFSAQVRNGELTGHDVSYGTCPLSHADKAVLTAYPAGTQPFTSDLSSTRRLPAAGGARPRIRRHLPHRPADDRGELHPAPGRGRRGRGVRRRPAAHRSAGHRVRAAVAAAAAPGGGHRDPGGRAAAGQR